MAQRLVTTNDMKQRTKQFALRVIRLTEALPKGRLADVLGRQLLRSGTSVGANYRSACRAKSRADFIAKMGIVEEELDECMYWLDLIIEESLVSRQRLTPLMAEANELLAMTVSSIRTARNNRPTKARKTAKQSKEPTASKKNSAIRTPQSAI
ncbi:MAG: four helix bundle protein [Planctomycetota bacterium]|jgi:four helix bundle protein